MQQRPTRHHVHVQPLSPWRSTSRKRTKTIALSIIRSFHLSSRPMFSSARRWRRTLHIAELRLWKSVLERSDSPAPDACGDFPRRESYAAVMDWKRACAVADGRGLLTGESGW